MPGLFQGSLQQFSAVFISFDAQRIYCRFQWRKGLALFAEIDLIDTLQVARFRSDCRYPGMQVDRYLTNVDSFTTLVPYENHQPGSGIK